MERHSQKLKGLIINWGHQRYGAQNKRGGRIGSEMEKRAINGRALREKGVQSEMGTCFID